MAFTLVAMASNLMAMAISDGLASTQIAMAANPLIAMASTQIAKAAKLIALASNQ